MSELLLIEAAHTIDESVTSAMARLLPQLAPAARIPSAATLQSIVDQECSTLLLARQPARNGEIVGALTLVVCRIPTGTRAWIEDVVVDVAQRGRGIGEALMREAIQVAASRGAESVDLTSRPSREAANRLYQRMGFAARETNCYRYAIGRDAP